MTTLPISSGSRPPAMRVAAKPEMTASQWRPIETALRDRDTKIDLWLVDRKSGCAWREANCWWSNGWTALRSSLTGEWVCGKRYLKNGNWYYDQLADDENSTVATHWMSLPAPPSPEGTG